MGTLYLFLSLVVGAAGGGLVALAISMKAKKTPVPLRILLSVVVGGLVFLGLQAFLQRLADNEFSSEAAGQAPHEDPIPPSPPATGKSPDSTPTGLPQTRDTESPGVSPSPSPPDQAQVNLPAPPVAPLYAWAYLQVLTPVDNIGGYEFDSISIGNAPFAHALYDYGRGGITWIEWNLNGRCTEFTGTAGLSSTSQSDGSADVEVLLDGNEVFKGNFSLLTSQPIVLDTTGHQRLRIWFTPTGPNKHGAGAVGDPRIYCRS